MPARRPAQIYIVQKEPLIFKGFYTFRSGWKFAINFYYIEHPKPFTIFILMQIKVSIVEDKEEIREGMKFLVNQTPEFSCLSAYSNAEDAVTGLAEQQPDLVIMDINLRGMTGIDCIRELKSRFPVMQFI